MTVTFCGHSQITNQKDVEEWLSDTLNSLLYLGATTFYLGGYVSFDILCATILRQKKYHPNIKLILVLPYLNTHKDLSLYDSRKPDDPEKFEIEIGGTVYTDKKEAGTAIVSACKDIKTVDKAMNIGNYMGFNMRVEFLSIYKTFQISLKNESVLKASLGSDALGNITRINNLLESLPKKLKETEEKLENVKGQMEDAKEELKKPFAKEAELNEKPGRLSELNALLNMDVKEETLEDEPKKMSIHDRLEQAKDKVDVTSTFGNREVNKNIVI